MVLTIVASTATRLTIDQEITAVDLFPRATVLWHLAPAIVVTLTDGFAHVMSTSLSGSRFGILSFPRVMAVSGRGTRPPLEFPEVIGIGARSSAWWGPSEAEGFDIPDLIFFLCLRLPAGCPCSPHGPHVLALALPTLRNESLVLV